MSLLMSLIKSTLTSHYRILHSRFYIISPHVSSSSSSSSPSANNCHFKFILLSYLVTFSYGTFYMPYEATGQIQWDDLLTNQYTFTFQMLPPEIASQFAAANNLSIAVSLLLIICLWKAPKVAADFRLLPPETGDELFRVGQSLLLDRAQSLKIRQCFQFVTFAYYSILLPTYFNLLAFYFVGLWRNGLYTVSAGSVVFWFILNPLMTFYLVYAFFAASMSIIIPTRLIQIRQGALCDRLNRLVNISSQNQCKNGQNNFQHLCRLIPQLTAYLQLNGRLLHICRHIEAYSATIQLFASLAIPYFTLIYCFILFVLFFGQLHSIQKLLYWSAVVSCNVFLFEITNEAARIERMNRAVEVQCRRFYLRYSAFCQVSRSSIFSIRRQYYRVLQVAELAVPERLKKYAFSLGGSNRITARTYDLILYYISTCFIYIVKHHQYTTKLKNSN